MLKREHMPHVLGAATLALMFSAVSVHPQTTTGTSGTSGAGAASSSTAADSRTPGQTGGASSSAATTSGSSSDKGASAKSAAGGSGKLAKADQQVMRDMAISNLAEIETGKLAQTKSQDEKVKAYAQRMVDEHTKAQGELEQLAQSKGVDLPKEPDAKHKAAAKKLSALEGEKFDKQYMAQGGVKDHRDTHKKLQKAAKNVKDPEVKALVTKMTPIVEDHLQTAQQASGKGGSAKSASGKADVSSGSSAGGASGSGNK